MNTFLTLGGGLFVILSICYCYYFDQQRRNAPDFKQKLKEKRKIEKENEENETREKTKLPDSNDYVACQMFVVKQIELAEEALAQEDVRMGTLHLSNAVKVLRKPDSLLNTLQQNLDPAVYQRLLQNIAEE